MLLRLLLRLASRRPYFSIYGLGSGDLYMERWWLLGGSCLMRDSDGERPVSQPRLWSRSRLDAFLGRFVGVRLHHIVRADQERDLHDHPSAFISVILKGSYVEQLPMDQSQAPIRDSLFSEKRSRKVGSIRLMEACDRHAIREVSEGGAWTLFVMFGKKQQWGFYPKDGYVPSREYFARRAQEPSRSAA